jgi:ZIP family zinc transporter
VSTAGLIMVIEGGAGMTGAWTAGGWGLFAGAALVVGAVAGVLWRVPSRWVALVMAFGSGVLISAVSFELVAEAYERAGMLPSLCGAVVGAGLYSGANVLLSRRGARHRKRSGGRQPSEEQQPGSGSAIAVGALLDGIPESVVIGTSLLGGGHVGMGTVAAVFISNLPEGLASASGMRASDTAMAVITALAGGAILCMIADTMIPEAFEKAHLLTGLVTVLGFLTAFLISHQ